MVQIHAALPRKEAMTKLEEEIVSFRCSSALPSGPSMLWSFPELVKYMSQRRYGGGNARQRRAWRRMWTCRGVGRPRFPVTEQIAGSNPVESAKLDYLYGSGTESDLSFDGLLA